MGSLSSAPVGNEKPQGRGRCETQPPEDAPVPVLLQAIGIVAIGLIGLGFALFGLTGHFTTGGLLETLAGVAVYLAVWWYGAAYLTR
jgi:hypothetical protein